MPCIREQRTDQFAQQYAHSKLFGNIRIFQPDPQDIFPDIMTVTGILPDLISKEDFFCRKKISGILQFQIARCLHMDIARIYRHFKVHDITVIHCLVFP